MIEKALELGGYPEDQEFTGINGGTDGHDRVCPSIPYYAAAGTIADAVKGGAYPALLPGRRMRRGPTRTKLLYGFCKTDAVGYGQY